jgi:hypothetical protein
LAFAGASVRLDGGDDAFFDYDVDWITEAAVAVERSYLTQHV